MGSHLPRGPFALREDRMTNNENVATRRVEDSHD